MTTIDTFEQAQIIIEDEQSKTPLTDNGLIAFIKEWGSSYFESVKDIPLFNPHLTQSWSTERLSYFTKVFYHARGYFKDFLWQVGNFSPKKTIKDIILHNIGEEFNKADHSHEYYYHDFAKQCGVDIVHEITTKENYLPEIRAFNEGHLQWLRTHSWQHSFAAFSAYECLDPTDYKLIAAVSTDNHKFFALHQEVEHFETTYNELQLIWDDSPNTVQEAFEYISETQAQMWNHLSDAVFSYQPSTA